jgi:hypothetical protein
MLSASVFGQWSLMGSVGNKHDLENSGTVYTTGGLDILTQKEIE